MTVSKDPFEELFGPIDEEPKPVPARERLAYEQAERIKTAPLPTRPEKPAKEKPAKQKRDRKAEKQAAENAAAATGPVSTGVAATGAAATGAAATASGSAPDDRIAKAKPWIIVGLVTVVALVASIVVLNLARADEDPSSTAAPTTQEPTTSKPATSTSASDDEEEDEDRPADEVPEVEVGPTGEMNVPTWGITAQISGKFGWPQYVINGEQLVLTGSPLIESLPDSCAAMRQQWGIQRTADGKYEVLKPAERCEAAPELYDELWGLTDALVQSVVPL